MGIVYSVIVKYYDAEENYLKKFELPEPSEELFNIFHVPEYSKVTMSNHLSAEEIADLKINYDKESNSVLEGYAEYIAKIEEPLIVHKKWTMFKSRLAKSFR